MGTDDPVKAVLTIGGLDPTGGSGILADARVVLHHGLHHVAALTTVTAQNSRSVAMYECVRPLELRKQVESILSEMPVASVKIGMVGCHEMVGELVEIMKGLIQAPLVFDPVLASSSGFGLFRDNDPKMVLALLPFCRLFTPNLMEASTLLDRSVDSIGKMRAAAKELREQGAKAVLIKGGHLDGPATDVLYDGIQYHEFVAPRNVSSDVRGTGCALSTAVACQLALDRELPEAVHMAKKYVSDGLERAYVMGRSKPFLP